MGYLKEPSPWDSSFEHPNHMLKIMVILLKSFVYLNPWSTLYICLIQLYMYICICSFNNFSAGHNFCRLLSHLHVWQVACIANYMDQDQIEGSYGLLLWKKLVCIIALAVFCQGHALAPLALKKSIWCREIPIDGPLGVSVFPPGRIVHFSIK